MFEADFHTAIGSRTAPLPDARFWIYRNNVAAALASALEVRYPVTAMLTGSEFFRGMAGVFSEAEKPASPVLIEYGAAFPDFIAQFPPAASVPYLADVARLESLWWQAYHAPDVEALPLSTLASLAPEMLENARLTLHPSVGLMASAFAVADIWMAHRGGPPLAEIAIGAPQSVLVARPAATVELRPLPPAAFAFVSRLAAGERLADAIENTSALHPDFDAAAQITSLFGLGLITGLNP